VTLEFHRTELVDLVAVTELLVSVFNSTPDSPFVNPQLLRWKYFESGPQWEGPRSYMLRRAGQVHAHCALWPLNLHYSGAEITCLCYIDWANRSDLPGAGFMLKKKLMKLADTSIVVGGSAETREIVPKLGYVHVSDVTSFARVVRPWKQFRTRPSEALLKGTARLSRNTLWTVSSSASIPRDWSAVQVDSFGGSLDLDHELPYPTPWRSAHYLNFWLTCPAADVRGYQVLHKDSVIGYFLLSRVGGQTRIADIRLNSKDPQKWEAVYQLATNAAAQLPETCEILAAASTPLASNALVAGGFRNRGSSPLFLYDPKKKLAGLPPIFWNMIEGDAAYLNDPSYPFVT
jgi:hypothetical protein